MAVKAPEFALKDVEGQTVRLEDLKGQPSVLVFYKSTCPYCQEAMPQLQKVFDRYAGKPVQVLGVVVGKDDARAAQNFARQYGLSLRAVLDEGKEVRQAYGLRKVPTLFFLDAEGNILRTYVGQTPRLAEATAQAMAALVGEGNFPDYAEEGHG